MKANAKGWLKRAEDDVKILKEAYTQSSKVVQNSKGDVETWHAKMTPEEFEETVEKQFKEFKENFLKNVEEKLSKTDKISYNKLKDQSDDKQDNKNS